LASDKCSQDESMMHFSCIDFLAYAELHILCCCLFKSYLKSPIMGKTPHTVLVNISTYEVSNHAWGSLIVSHGWGHACVPGAQ
jgi:hypothetical protein